ncbi:MAG: DUF2851 family protein [Candidatus Halalkalibacterium sp. M3_1C_030]
MSRDLSYPEELLHWIWKTSRLDSECLKTVSGEPVTVYEPGKPNIADGPDFLNARIQIGDLEWFGDVEIHWQTNDWNLHRHQHDTNYNRVVLHAVWNHDESTALRQDQTVIPTIQIRNYLSGNLQSFLEQYRKPEHLPCSAHLTYISHKAFEKQLELAKRQYFEQKVDKLLKLWDPSLPPSRAWQKMLATGLFDSLGISHNRRPLRKLCIDLYPLLENAASKNDLISLALFKSGIDSEIQAEQNDWNHKGSRPANHPKVRIKQAASYLWEINCIPFKKMLKGDPELLWEGFNLNKSDAGTPGKQTKKILFSTVWLPSFFILGNIFGSRFLKNRSYELWEKHESVIPKNLLEPFLSLDVPASVYEKTLGSVYQLSAYCKPRHCNKCKVFKSVISS